MVGLGHGGSHPAEQEEQHIIDRNARNGMRLFVLYLIIYGGFVGLSAFAPQQMESTPLFGVNLAVLYGFALIGAAIVLALIYCWQCRSSQAPPPA